MKTRSTLLFLLALAVTFCAQAQDAATKIANLGQMSYNEASSTVDAIVNQNRQLASTLTKEIEQPNFPPDSKTCAIYLLGELHPRDISSIHALVENIDFAASRRDIGLTIGRWGTYPAQEALAKIGMPAVYVILRVYLPTENNQLRRHLMCSVLQGVLGKDLGTIAIKQKLDKESDSAKKLNLQAALQELQKN
jgi:hypothetical protein